MLLNIKSNSISNAEAKQIGTLFLNLTQEQVNNLGAGFFGIYIRPETSTQTRQNIHYLLPLLWDRIDESTRQQFGIKYKKFVASNDQEESTYARQFLELISGTSYIPDDLRAVDIEVAIDNLLAAHRNFNNFHNEPPFAKELHRLVGEKGKVPLQIQGRYVEAIVEVYLTNGNGVSWGAEGTYQVLLNQFDANQALKAVLSFNKDSIASQLQFQLCQKKFLEMLEIMKDKVSSPAVKELIADIDRFTGPLDKMRNDSRIKQKVNILLKILN